MGHQVTLISCHKPSETLNPEIRFEKLPVPDPWGYYLNSASLKKILGNLEPDILNAHYASGYGTLARLSGFSPKLLSVWGSDVYDFPRKSRLHRSLIIKNLQAADAIASTSHCMLDVTNNLYQHKRTYITPFGIDTESFSPKLPAARDKIIIGTVKTLAYKYGIDTLLEAFYILLERTKDNRLYLEITGDGPDRMKLEQQAKQLGIADRVSFYGRVNHADVPEKLRRLDIYAALSRLDSESFGVAILEASACALPVVVSDVDGLKEVVRHMETGIIVRKESAEEAAGALETLINDRELGKRMGLSGRDNVEENYTWKSSLEKMINAYGEISGVNR